MSEGEASVAVNVLAPSAPIKARDPKVARPLAAFLWAVPEIVALEIVKVTCWLFPVTRLLS